jgi:L-threonylcarbamoyladenylate synthase
MMRFGAERGNRDATSRSVMNMRKTEHLCADAAGIARAADLLKAGGLVAFPTETVYGLGADARNGQAVARIYEAKGRPSFNPLIVHVADLASVERLGELDEAARALLAGGWPAGLTLVLPLRGDAGLSPLVTAGLESVAVRVPASPLALSLLRAFGGPVAAPSANPSGKISSTTADHVLRGLGGRIDAVIDGGATRAGLESTIISFTGPKPVLLREGAFQPPAGMVFGQPEVDANRPVAPGQLASHYAPEASIRLNATEPRAGEFLIGFGPVAGDVTLSEGGDLVEAAARLFALFHEADARGVTRLAVAPVPETGLGRAINDRLRRAAAPRG